MVSTTYPIGARFYRNGDEIEIIGEEFELHGGMWQMARTPVGKNIAVPTPGQLAKNKARRQAAVKAMQDGYRRIKAAQ
jgi:hypothetical protein